MRILFDQQNGHVLTGVDLSDDLKQLIGNGRRQSHRGLVEHQQLAQLPKTMTEKVEKYKLRAAAESRLSEIWDREKAGIKITR